MGKKKELDPVRVAAYANRMRGAIARATLSDVEQATTWYEDAEQIAHVVAELAGVPVEHGAAIISAFSPRMPWARNVMMALEFAQGYDVRAMGSHLRAAEKAREHGIDALNGPKTNAFARAIAGDVDAVVIDVWMARACGLPTDAPTIVQYRETSEAVRVLAIETGLAPRTVQALVWIVVRGGAE